MTSQVRCKTHERRGSPGRNAIDYLEVLANQLSFDVVFFHPITGIEEENLSITGGTRVTGLRVTSLSFPNNKTMRVWVDRPGDFSTYTFRIVTSPTSDAPPPNYDPQGVTVEFSFKAGCPSRFDCIRTCNCPPELPAPPEIDYLARDYATFRRLMLDRLALVLPSWRERNPADLGVVLVELLAYVADHLSYQLDAVATEAYLGTARRRASLRRIARLLDYDMHDGCNARAWVQLRMKPGTATIVVPRSTLLCTKGSTRGTVLGTKDIEALASSGAEFFETMEEVTLRAGYDVMPFYTWGNRHCCLPKGATSATLEGNYPALKAGTVLVLRELVGPESGHPSDADPRHAHAVRLDKDAITGTDPLTNGQVTEIEWSSIDALPFTLCISATTANGYSSSISAALGNIVLTDHGRTLTGGEILPKVVAAAPFLTPVPAASQSCDQDDRDPAPPRYAPLLRSGPVTQTATLARSRFAANANAGERPKLFDPTAPAATVFDVEPRTAIPAITLNDGVADWFPRRDLLGSHSFDPHFVVEVERDGSASLRFGDDTQGRRPDPDQTFTATYRIGNGPAGNVGIGAIAHVISDTPAVALNVVAVTNPLPARGGIAPEEMEDVRQKAPVAFRRQERAVTPADYEEVAQRHPEIQRAAATFRWTGSWYTVFLTVDRAGGRPVDEPFERDVRAHLERYRMAGYDLEIDAPRYVPIELALHVCVQPEFFRSDVEAALRKAFAEFFHPDRFTFAQPVHLSHIYAAAHAVPGVASVTVDAFNRQGVPNSSGIPTGTLKMQRLEIAQLASDPNFPDRGVLRLMLDGGR